MGLLRLFYRNKTFILLLFLVYFLVWITIPSLKQPPDFYEVQKANRDKYRSNTTFYYILNQLFQSKFNIILIDPDVLTDLFIRRLPFDELNEPLVTFAIIDQAVQPLLQTLHRMRFSFQTSTTALTNHTSSIDHIFIQHEHKTLHLAVLHRHHSFYLVRRNDLRLSNSDNVPLLYGDKLRAVEHVESELHEYLFYYPRNVSHFLWLYDTSEYLHCNRALANRMENEYHLYQNASKFNTTVIPMLNVVHIIEKLEKHYWLAGGALLGWYRHCGLIPYTHDSDFGLFAEEYDETIRSHFLGNPVTYLWSALGLVNDSLEFRLYTGRYTLDLFWAYRDGDHRWFGYQFYRRKYRRTLPLLQQLCSCSLFGYRFSIPCSPEQYLDEEYGQDTWKTPLEKNYTWTNMKYHSMWDDVSWMYAVRLYTPQGKLRTDQFAFDWILNYFNYSLTSIPSFLNILPNETVTLPPLRSNYTKLFTEKQNITRKSIDSVIQRNPVNNTKRVERRHGKHRRKARKLPVNNTKI